MQGFRNVLIFFAMTSFSESALSYFYISIKLTHCLLNFDSLFSERLSVIDPYFSRDRLQYRFLAHLS